MIALNKTYGTQAMATCVIAGLLATAVAAQQEELPAPDNYAWGFAIATDERASFYTIKLPLDVYVSAADARLRDLSVYNAASQPVPRVIEADAADVEQTETRRTLPFAALFRDAEPDPERIRLIFEQRDGATLLDLRSSDGGDEKMRPPLTGYVVDARRVDGGIDALELAWPPFGTGFVGRVQVAGSNDLLDWTSLGSGAVADLSENGADIVKRRIDLSGVRHEFLRLTWTGVPPDWRLDRIDGLQRDARTSVQREWLTLNPVGRDETDGGLLFDSLGPLPVDRLNLELPETNSVVGARVYYRLNGQSNWSLAHHGTFFNVERGSLPATNDAEPVSLRRAADWKVVLTSGRPDTPVNLELGWRPDTLLFIAQGRPPYTLAVGREDAVTDRFPEDRLLGTVSLGGIATDNGPVARAMLGERYALAGVARAADPIDWRRLVLWFALSAAVLFVGWMAMRLTRGLSSD